MSECSSHKILKNVLYGCVASLPENISGWYEDGELVVVTTIFNKDDKFSFNKTAIFIYELLAGREHVEVDVLITEVATHYHLSNLKLIREDVYTYIRELWSLALIKWVG